jgi:hypothetical protein
MRVDANELTDLDQEYYVIVGCGFSAVTNHAILARQPAGRLGGLPVLHIGGTDPWRSYFPMPMGQWPTLLSLPGFGSRPSSMLRSANLHSNEFADVTDDEWNRLMTIRPFYAIDSRVQRIDLPAIPTAPYLIVLDNKAVIRAAYIDICGGPGPAEGLDSAAYVDPTLEWEYDNGAGTPFPWPRVLSGQKYLSSSTTARTTAGRICIVGGGPTAAWCVERAQNSGDTVYWMSREPLASAFVSSRRNDGLLQGPVTRRFNSGNHEIDSVILPSSPTAVFGEGVEVSQLATNYKDEVVLQVHPAAKATAKFVDSSGTIAAVTSLTVDQVVVAFGQQTEAKHAGSWATMLATILNVVPNSRNHLIDGREGRVVGLQSRDERVRVLGAAALAHPDFRPEWRTKGTPSNIYFRSLAEQARVYTGIAVAALTIAEANQFWSTTTINTNLNTAGFDDLAAITASWHPAADGATTWFEMRAVRVPPFSPFEFLWLLFWPPYY